jgi:hypothetical protein
MTADHSSYDDLARERRDSADYRDGYAEAQRAAFLVGHMISLSLTARLRPPATVPGLSPRRTPDTTAPPKEERI